MRALVLIVIAGMWFMPESIAGEPPSKTTLGGNEALVAGSRALMVGNYEAGIRLTLRGLKSENSRLRRARALSNLCAGYTGTREHDKALEACNQALEINSVNWRAYNNRALALIGLGARLGSTRRSRKGAGAEARLSEARQDSGMD